ncbi:hypothetical protein ACOMHN_044226 [Nucella lapillus]
MRETLMGVPCALDVMLIECRLCATRCEDLSLRKHSGPPRVEQQLPHHKMQLVFNVQRTHHSYELVFSQSVRVLPLDEFDESIQWLICTKNADLTFVKELSRLHRQLHRMFH